jgi:hypothetical protein
MMEKTTKTCHLAAAFRKLNAALLLNSQPGACYCNFFHIDRLLLRIHNVTPPNLQQQFLAIPNIFLGFGALTTGQISVLLWR